MTEKQEKDCKSINTKLEKLELEYNLKGKELLPILSRCIEGKPKVTTSIILTAKNLTIKKYNLKTSKADKNKALEAIERILTTLNAEFFKEELSKVGNIKSKNHSYNAICLEGVYTFVFYNSYDSCFEERELTLTLVQTKKDKFSVVLQRSYGNLVGEGEINQDNHLELNYSEESSYNQHAIFKLPHRINENFEILVGTFVGRHQSILYHHIGVLINQKNVTETDVEKLRGNTNFWDKAHRSHYFLTNEASKLYLDKIDDTCINYRNTTEVEKYLPIKNSKLEGTYKIYSRAAQTTDSHTLNVNTACIKREDKEMKVYVKGKAGLLHEGVIEKRTGFYQVRSIRSIELEDKDAWSIFTFTINEIENIKLFIGFYAVT